MLFQKTCVICGSAFESTVARAKYCSDECKKKGRAQTAKAWREEHPNYHRDYFREHGEDIQKAFKEKHPNYDRDRSRRLRGSKEHHRKCVICGQPFTAWNPNTITCSPQCRDENARRRDIERSKKRKRDPEKEHERWIMRRYGSHEAYQKYLDEVAAEKEKQKKEREKEKRKEREARRIQRSCVVCGNAFETLNPRQRTCSKECGKKLTNGRKSKRIPKSQIIDKDITLEALYRRDSGVCYLCGGKCDWSDKTEKCVGGKYPTVDHVFPISLGGLHSWDNVRLAHFACNIQKSNTPLAEQPEPPENAYVFKRDVKPQKKKVEQRTSAGDVIAVYESTAEAARTTGYKSRQIQNCARGERKTYKGYSWAYV